MNARSILASAVVFVGITLILQSADFWIESLGAALTAAAAAYMGWKPCADFLGTARNPVSDDSTPSDGGAE